MRPFEREMLFTMNRVAAALEALSRQKSEKPSDAEVYHYMKSLGLPLPPIREIAKAVGWSHGHLLNADAMPLSAGYFRLQSGRFKRRGRSESQSEDEGRFDE